MLCRTTAICIFGAVVCTHKNKAGHVYVMRFWNSRAAAIRVRSVATLHCEIVSHAPFRYAIRVSNCHRWPILARHTHTARHHQHKPINRLTKFARSEYSQNFLIALPGIDRRQLLFTCTNQIVHPFDGFDFLGGQTNDCTLSTSRNIPPIRLQ